MIEKKLGNVSWFTNIDHDVIPDFINLVKEYNSEEYPFYDNYNAININKTKDIPKDYFGVMGVPITFMTKYNPEQFEIVGMSDGDNEMYNKRHKYINPLYIRSNGNVSNGNDANNHCPSITKAEIPLRAYYTADGVNGYIKKMYDRILIKRK